jgi:uncharacterized protein YbjQ (UPF0145 family)
VIGQRHTRRVRRALATAQALTELLQRAHQQCRNGIIGVALEDDTFNGQYSARAVRWIH